MEDTQVRNIAGAISYGRIAIGIGALVAPGLASRVIRFPEEHDNASMRAMSRLFGAREVAVGALTLRGLDERAGWSDLIALNAAVDGADALAFAAALVRRRGIDRAAFGSFALALPVVLTWLHLRKATGSDPTDLTTTPDPADLGV